MFVKIAVAEMPALTLVSGRSLVASILVWTGLRILALIWTSDESITVARIAGVVLGFAGVLALMFDDLRAGLVGVGMRRALLGQLAIVVTSLCYA